MIICNREEANKLLDEESNLFKNDERNKDIISDFIDYETKTIKHGRGIETLNVEEERRKEIALLSLTSGLSNEEVSKFTGVSASSVSAYKVGAKSTDSYHNRDNELGEAVKDIKTEITGLANNKLKEAIELITGDKMILSKATELSSIAKDMSVIVKNFSPDGPVIQNNKVLIYQPRIREESEFEIIEVRE